MVARRFMLLAASATVFASAASAACRSDDASPSDVAKGESGAASGAEVHVTVYGRGRVTTETGAVDCPSACFAEIPGADAGGVKLRAEPAAGATFTGWRFDSVVLGVRGGGPDTCSPMKRESSVPSVALANPEITLPLGGTRAWPPVGRESECADFTNVPLAYSVSATFAEKPVVEASDVEELFAMGSSGSEAHELGIIGGRLYWRFQVAGDLRAGIATGLATGGPSSVIVPPVDPITAFDVDAHVVYQRAGTQTTQWRIPGGAVAAEQLNGLTGYFCDALASEVTKVYCLISFSGGPSSIYAWPPGTGNTVSFVYSLPWRSKTLAVDDEFLFYSEDDQGGAPAAAIIRNGPKTNPGGQVTPFPRVIGQTAPRDLRTGNTYLYWLDDGLAAGATVARIGARADTSARELASVAGARLMAPDPDGSSGVLWVGTFDAKDGFSIVKASPKSKEVVRTKLPALSGLAVDGSYVYWTQGDAKVYRAKK